MKATTIELLSPAKDCAVGMAAINHGADAVYIGGPDFGIWPIALHHSTSLIMNFDVRRNLILAYKYTKIPES